MPNKDRIKLWIDALRSGDFKQAKNKLKYSDGYCCLGVACEVFMKTSGSQWEWEEGGRLIDTQSVLPRDVVEWFELQDRAPKCDGRFLTELNDSGNYDFNQIANIIEKEWLT